MVHKIINKNIINIKIDTKKKKTKRKYIKKSNHINAPYISQTVNRINRDQNLDYSTGADREKENTVNNLITSKIKENNILSLFKQPEPTSTNLVPNNTIIPVKKFKTKIKSRISHNITQNILNDKNDISDNVSDLTLPTQNKQDDITFNLSKSVSDFTPSTNKNKILEGTKKYNKHVHNEKEQIKEIPEHIIINQLRKNRLAATTRKKNIQKEKDETMKFIGKIKGQGRTRSETKRNRYEEL